VSTRAHWRRADGFTLLEAVFALAVTAVALLWLVSAGRYAVEASEVAAGRTRAATLASSLAAEMQAGLMSPDEREGTFDDAPGYTWEAKVSQGSDGEVGSCCRKVVLRVSFAGMGHAEEDVELEFLVADG
jgi:Tfp pilus assembly protein PilV